MTINCAEVGDTIPAFEVGDTFPTLTNSQWSTTATMTIPMTDALRRQLLPFEPEDDEYDEEEHGELISPTDFVEKILRNGDATIVFWADGTKTVVRYSGDEEDSDYTAFTAAFAIKCFGSNSHLKKVIKNKIVYRDTPKKKKKPEKIVAEPPTEFMLGDWVTIKTLEHLTGGFPRQITAVNRRDGTYMVEGISGTWWRAGALQLAEHKETDDVGKDGGH